MQVECRIVDGLKMMCLMMTAKWWKFMCSLKKWDVKEHKTEDKILEINQC